MILVWNQTLSEADVDRRMIQGQYWKSQYESIRQFRDNLLQRGPVQVMCHRNQISEGLCNGRDLKKILADMRWIPRYTTEPNMGLSI